MFEKITAIAAVISILISILALYFAKSGSDKSTSIAIEALKTARQANKIAFGRLRESPVIEIFSKHDERMNFTNEENIQNDLEVVISIHNTGKISIDGLSMELIGIKPLTYQLGDETKPIEPLPSIKININLDTIIQPDALAHIDLRLPVLMYLKQLNKIIPNKSKQYMSSVNVVLHPKAVGDSLPTGVLSKDTTKDRVFIKLLFLASITETKVAIKLLSENNVIHRVYSP